MGEGSEQIIAIKIGNRTYHVRSANDPEYVKLLARFLDERMQEIAGHTPTVDTMKVAILTALHIADQYFSTKRELDALKRTVDHRGSELLRILEPLLGAKAP